MRLIERHFRPSGICNGIHTCDSRLRTRDAFVLALKLACVAFRVSDARLLESPVAFANRSKLPRPLLCVPFLASRKRNKWVVLCIIVRQTSPAIYLPARSRGIVWIFTGTETSFPSPAPFLSQADRRPGEHSGIRDRRPASRE